jgi:hypothetical protein
MREALRVVPEIGGSEQRSETAAIAMGDIRSVIWKIKARRVGSEYSLHLGGDRDGGVGVVGWCRSSEGPYHTRTMGPCTLRGCHAMACH